VTSYTIKRTQRVLHITFYCG